MNIKKINWFGLTGGLITLVLVVLSLAYASPWWQLTLGQEVGQANISPLNFSLSMLGTPILIPIVWFMNLISLLSLLACAIAILIYSVVPDKTFSKNLLGFAYKKPLIITILFLVLLFVATHFIGSIFHISIPLAGSTNVTLGLEGTSVEIPITTGFTWIFCLAVIAAGLCIAARLYHRRIGASTVVTTQTQQPSPKP